MSGLSAIEHDEIIISILRVYSMKPPVGGSVVMIDGILFFLHVDILGPIIKNNVRNSISNFFPYSNKFIFFLQHIHRNRLLEILISIFGSA